MPILATYGQFSTYVDAQGRYRVIWQWDDGGVEMRKFETVLSDSEVEWQMWVERKRREYPEYPKLPFDADNNRAVIIAAVTHIRTHPALTLAQWNQYLNALNWYDAYCVRAFIFRLAQGLAQYYGVNLGTMTETSVLLAVRNWICNTALNIVQAVIFDRIGLTM